jgi:hypothetical protein
MSSWCENSLMVKGDTDYLARIREELASTTPRGLLDFSFDKVIPRPVGSEYDPELWGGSEDIGDEMAGIVKWEVKRVQQDHWVEETLDTMSISFFYDIPPFKVIEAMVNRYPEADFTFRYSELGNEFAGYRLYVAGKCTESVHTTDEDLTSFIGDKWFDRTRVLDENDDY